MTVPETEKDSSHLPPDGLLRYRLLTGKDDATFCTRVSEALSQGYELHGSPAATFNGQDVIVAQAIIWPEAQQNKP
ncbi:DUF1737 domain-containing protein [Pantoea sp. AG702]|uniref:DUF1737 domain-containing protein n=1 Tax=Pantoea sp. AG702 TaxID=2183907 RepID=UPI000D716ACD|nr:DUF1737 domain-containing protein [Pantoea sp. AG702]PWW11074.1 uncharacterized protein DUF1737 [Pantoea sp. AG702]